MSTYHVLHYVEHCESKTKKFKTKTALAAFRNQFKKKYPPEPYADNWLVMSIFDVAGDIQIHDDSVKIDKG